MSNKKTKDQIVSSVDHYTMTIRNNNFAVKEYLHDFLIAMFEEIESCQCEEFYSAFNSYYLAVKYIDDIEEEIGNLRINTMGDL